MEYRQTFNKKNREETQIIMKETFYSFSTNYEDLVIAHALKNIPAKDVFWIDVGANDPIRYSNTAHFSAMGGHGINCEPLPYNYELQKKFRPCDDNLNVAVADKNSVMQIVDKDTTSYLTDKKTKHTLTCNVRTAKELFAGYGNKDVHFCSVDVEGHELDVLKGWDFSTVRPWIFCLESYGDTEKALRELLENNGYLFVFRDDANIFLVSEEHKDIADKMKKGHELLDEYNVTKMTEYIDYVRASVRKTYSFRIGYALTQPVRIVANAVKNIGK